MYCTYNNRFSGDSLRGVELSRPEVEAEAVRLRVPVVRATRGRVDELVEEARAAKGVQSEGWVLKAAPSVAMVTASGPSAERSCALCG